MCNFKSALLIPRFPTSDGFDLFHRDGVNSHTELMELANINPNDSRVNVAKLELVPNLGDDLSNVNTWEFILDENRKPDWLDDSMLSDVEYEMRQLCSRYITKDGEYTVLDTGVVKYWYLNGRLHREDGPAVEYNDGRKSWYINGKLHRKDGPAVEYADEKKSWYINGKRHRTDGPAIEWYGDKEWFINGKRHREDGPAIEFSNGEKEWYIHGMSLTEEQFNRQTYHQKKI